MIIIIIFAEEKFIKQGKNSNQNVLTKELDICRCILLERRSGIYIILIFSSYISYFYNSSIFQRISSVITFHIEMYLLALQTTNTREISCKHVNFTTDANLVLSSIVVIVTFHPIQKRHNRSSEVIGSRR